MGFSVYRQSNVKHKAGSVYSVTDSPETLSATLSLASDISRIEAALLSLSSIQDCVVLERATEAKPLERVAYVVPSESVNPQQLHLQLQGILPTTPLPTTYIPLSVLPLTARGQVDPQALNTVVVDPNRLQHWQYPLRSLSESSVDEETIHHQKKLPSHCDQSVQHQIASSLPLNDSPRHRGDRFYQKSWQIKPTTAEVSCPSTGQTLVLIDQLGFGTQLCEQLDQLNQSYIKVEPGSDFVRLSPNHYYLNPVNPTHYQQLLESIITEDLPITEILHLWTYHQSFRTIAQEKALEYTLDLGVHSLWFLSQALKAIQGEQVPVRLLVATNQTQAVQPLSRVSCDRTPEIRLLQTLSQEQPWLHCCHLDLPEVELTDNVNRILQELCTVPSDLEVTYHQDQRWVAVVEPVTLS